MKLKSACVCVRQGLRKRDVLGGPGGGSLKKEFTNSKLIGKKLGEKSFLKKSIRATKNEQWNRGRRRRGDGSKNGDDEAQLNQNQISPL